MSGIFISYRRGDAAGMTGRIYDRLKQSFGSTDIFMDVDGLKGGLDFVEQLDANLAQSSVLVAMIGPGWLDAKDNSGGRRLDGEHDFVRREIATALQRGIPVVPVVLDGAHMPSEDDLPDGLKPLARRHALELRHTRFSADAKALVETLSPMLPTQRRAHYGRWLAALGVVPLAAFGLFAVLRPDAMPWRHWLAANTLTTPGVAASTAAADGDRVAEDEAKKRGEAWLAHMTPEANRLANEGFKYHTGQGVPVDYAKARDYYEKAVGQPAALFNLGLLYANGQGLPKNDVKARELYQAAANLDYPPAMFALASLLRDGRGGPPDAAKARVWLAKASGMAYAPATNSLALMLRDGVGGPPDLVGARSLFELSSKRGNDYSFFPLARMVDRGQGGPADGRKAAVRLMDATRAAGEPGEAARKEFTGAMSDFSEATRKAAQQELTDLGFYSEPIDGLWNAGSKRAADRYLEKYAAAQAATTIKPSTAPPATHAPTAEDMNAAEDEAKKRGEAWRVHTTPETNRLTDEGFKYGTGQGVPVDYAKARDDYEKAVGNPVAIFNLGIYSDFGHGVPKDEAKGREFYQIAANLDYPKAMYNLALDLRNGWGGPRDDAKAREWYEKASSMGHPDAPHYLATMYRDGIGGATDLVRARSQFEVAIRRGSGKSLLSLAHMLDRGQGGPADGRAAAVRLMDGVGVAGTDGDLARKEFTSAMNDFSEATRKAVQQELTEVDLYKGPVDGLWSAGSRHAAELYVGKNAPAQSAVAAATKPEPAAPPLQPTTRPTADVVAAASEAEAKKRGDAWRTNATPEAIRFYDEGWKYQHGQGVPIDYVKAREYFEKAVGHAGASCDLGVLYALGQGVAKDMAKAIELYQIAADMGVPACMRNLGLHLRDGFDGVAADPAKARAWFEKASNMADAGSTTMLALMVKKGQGGPADLPKARALLQLAINRGEVTANSNLAYMLDHGEGGPADPVAAARRLMYAPGLVGTDGAWSRGQLTGAMGAFSEATRKAVQQELAQLGIYTGPVDGLWSATSQHAAELYIAKYVKPEKK